MGCETYWCPWCIARHPPSHRYYWEKGGGEGRAAWCAKAGSELDDLHKSANPAVLDGARGTTQAWPEPAAGNRARRGPRRTLRGSVGARLALRRRDGRVVRSAELRRRDVRTGRRAGFIRGERGGGKSTRGRPPKASSIASSSSNNPLNAARTSSGRRRLSSSSTESSSRHTSAYMSLMCSPQPQPCFDQ